LRVEWHADKVTLSKQNNPTTSGDDNENSHHSKR
jgi:hypothetical protein